MLDHIEDLKQEFCDKWNKEHEGKMTDLGLDADFKITVDNLEINDMAFLKAFFSDWKSPERFYFDNNSYDLEELENNWDNHTATECLIPLQEAYKESAYLNGDFRQLLGRIDYFSEEYGINDVLISSEFYKDLDFTQDTTDIAFDIASKKLENVLYCIGQEILEKLDECKLEDLEDFIKIDNELILTKDNEIKNTMRSKISR